MTPSGIEPATFGFLAQHLNQCATAVPLNTTMAVLRRNSNRYRWLPLGLKWLSEGKYDGLEITNFDMIIIYYDYI